MRELTLAEKIVDTFTQPTNSFGYTGELEHAVVMMGKWGNSDKEYRSLVRALCRTAFGVGVSGSDDGVFVWDNKALTHVIDKQKLDEVLTALESHFCNV